jgi:uncharacterized protein with HEPN domain
MPPETAKLLWDMLDAAGNIATFSAGKKFDDYLGDALLRSAVERQFEIIGEAMTRLRTRDVAVASKVTDFRKISGFRNALIHGYDSVDHVISWNIVQSKLPLLTQELQQLLEQG